MGEAAARQRPHVWNADDHGRERDELGDHRYAERPEHHPRDPARRLVQLLAEEDHRAVAVERVDRARRRCAEDGQPRRGEPRGRGDRRPQQSGDGAAMNMRESERGQEQQGQQLHSQEAARHRSVHPDVQHRRRGHEHHQHRGGRRHGQSRPDGGQISRHADARERLGDAEPEQIEAEDGDAPCRTERAAKDRVFAARLGKRRRKFAIDGGHRETQQGGRAEAEEHPGSRLLDHVRADDEHADAGRQAGQGDEQRPEAAHGALELRPGGDGGFCTAGRHRLSDRGDPVHGRHFLISARITRPRRSGNTERSIGPSSAAFAAWRSCASIARSAPRRRIRRMVGLWRHVMSSAGARGSLAHDHQAQLVYFREFWTVTPPRLRAHAAQDPVRGSGSP